jgi:hypothetical protein
MRLPRFLRLPLSFLVVLALVVPARAQNEVAARLQSDINALTRFPSRVPGTPGNRAAADFVRARFNELQLQDVRADEYLVTAPVTKQASLSLGGRNLEVFPVYPNQVVASTTPPEGLSGPLVYAKGGAPADFNGQNVDGAIVALDFDSGLNWITAADLGAKAIVFLESPNANRGEGRT